MRYTIETSQGFVQTIKTVGGEMHGATYTGDPSQARRFTKRQLSAMRVRFYFRYYHMTIIIAEAI